MKKESAIYRYAFFFVVVFLCARCAFAKITKGPVLLRVETGRAAVMWESDTEGDGIVEYGSGDELTAKTFSKPFRVLHRHGWKGKTVFIHKVWMNDLNAGETYRYRIASKTYSFQTIPEKVDKVRFAVYGDSRKHPDTHRKVIRRIKEAGVDFVIHTGDLVNSGMRYVEWGEQFFGPVKGLGEYVPIYVVKGNHDAGGVFERLFVMDGERNYSFRYGPLYYFLADNMTGDLATAKLLDILKRDRTKDAATWKFVSWHEPNLNLGGHMSDRGKPHALPRLSREGIDFVIAGHSHMYERFRPLAPVDAGASAVTYMTTGGGGADMSDVQPDFLLATAKKEHHFCLFEISGDRLSMKVINIDGKVIDRLELSKNAGTLNRAYTRDAVPIEAVLFHQEIVEELTAYSHTKPKKGKTFEATLKISKMSVDRDLKLVCQPRSAGRKFELPDSQSVTVKRGSGEIKLRFKVKSLVDVGLTYKKYFEPALYIHCEYDTPWGKAWTAVPVEYD